MAVKHKGFIKSQRLAVVLGLTFFVLGAFLLWDAWPHRGKNTPFPLGAAMPF